MAKIITDTSALFSVEEGAGLGIGVLPLSVTLDGQTYREFVDISSDGFLELLKKGGVPTSSQPSIGSVLDMYNRFPEEELLVLCMADGLSGTYQSACSAAKIADFPENITVLNTGTLAGPHRYLVEKAAALAQEGLSAAQISTQLQPSLENNKSFLIPNDFSFLKRGGRLTPLAAAVGGMLKIVPVMTQTEDRGKLEKFAMKRTFSTAIDAIAGSLAKLGVTERYKIYIVHADALELAEKARLLLAGHFPCVQQEILPLSPVFITQGGPGCVAVQAVLK